jgi:hypothetical protein
MVNPDNPWIALLFMAVSTWLYACWLWATEPRRQRREAEAREMQQIYRHLKSATVETLRSLLSREMKAYCIEKRRFRTMLICAALLHVAAYRFVLHAPAYDGGGVLLMLLVAWITLPSLFARHNALRTIRRRVPAVVVLLHKYQARNSIGVLIEAMECGDEATSNYARIAVIALLPCLSATEGSLLEDSHRAYLYRALRSYSSQLILAILPALEQIGDDQAIPYVERLIPGPVWLADSRNIEQAAQKCLLSLQERSKERQARQALLRATIASALPSDALLRPAQEVSAMEPQQLLRADIR